MKLLYCTFRQQRLYQQLLSMTQLFCFLSQQARLLYTVPPLAVLQDAVLPGNNWPLRVCCVLVICNRYDPVHYGVPEGSYSTAPDGALRVLEYREMVQVCDMLQLKCDPVACTESVARTHPDVSECALGQQTFWL